MINGNVSIGGKGLCGPFISGVAASDLFIKNIKSISFFEFIYGVFSNAEPLIILMIMIICLLFYRKYDNEMIKLYNIEKEKVSFYFRYNFLLI